MNEIRRPDRDAEEVARIREIVGRHPLPDFVTGFDVRLGEYDGDPAVWITLTLTGSDALGLDELQRRAKILLHVHNGLTDALLDKQDRFPFFRMRYAEVDEKTS